MKKIILFIAMSLDGYIADTNGGVDWLTSYDSDIETMDTYSTFFDNIDTVIMGWKTYEQIVMELSPTHWPYDNLKSYVITHHNHISTDKIEFTEQSPCDLVRQLRQETGKDIWICGGASIIQQLIKENLIDQYYISVIPTILGNGIHLFDLTKKKIDLKLLKTQNNNGIVDLIYERR